MLLIHPPISRPCEPPAGIAKLCGVLSHHGIEHTILDANLEGLLFLLKHSQVPSDTWTRRALRHLSDHLSFLKTWKAYQNLDRYRRAVKDINHLLEMAGHPLGAHLGLGNFEVKELSPARSRDLLRAAENPEGNPFYPYFKRRLLDRLEEQQPSIVGFSVNYLSQALTALAMIGFLKRECPGLALVLGGGLVTSWGRRPAWQNQFSGLVDHFIAGPGERALLSICEKEKSLQRGDEREPGRDHWIPDYASFATEDYFSPGSILPYSASSGCYWNRCAFCPERAEENPYLPIAAERVISDLQVLVKEVKPVLIHLLDNAISPSLMRAISENPPGAPWYGFARITRDLADLDLCMALKASGCVMLQLGLESGDPAVLDRMEKGIDLGEASRVLKNLKKAEIATYVYVLFGTPWETQTGAQKTLAFIAKHHDEIGFLNLAIFNLPVQSQQSSLVETESFYEGDLSLYTDFRHPRGWDRKSVRQFLDKEFKRHPAIAPILRRDPPFFTSNHAPLFVHGKSRGLPK